MVPKMEIDLVGMTPMVLTMVHNLAQLSKMDVLMARCLDSSSLMVQSKGQTTGHPTPMGSWKVDYSVQTMQ